MADYLALSQWRHLRSHPWLLWLSLLGVAFGVAGIIAMDLAIYSCQRAFQLSQESLSGAATHWIVGPPGGMDEDHYRRLRLELGIESCVPVVDGHVTLQLDPPQGFRLFGLEPIAEGPFRGAWLQQVGQGDLAVAFAAPGAVALSQPEAERLRWKIGQQLATLEGPSLRLVAVLEGLDSNRSQALQGMLLSDIAVAQEALGMVGKLSRIELILSPTQARQLATKLPEGLQLITAETLTQSRQQMSRAFFLNLKALSMLSLLVGLFLIYNVVHFLALQRRPWIARLRILGVSRREIRDQILAEAAWLGTLGSLLGVGLGILLAGLLLPLLSRTLNDLYYSLQVQQLQLDYLTLIKGCFLGWCCALLAAWLPALEASQVAPVESLHRSSLESRTRQGFSHLGRVALVTLLASLSLLFLSENVALNLVAMFGLILGSAALTPAWVLAFQANLLRSLPSHWYWLRLCLGNLSRSLSRLGIALIAMTVALSAVISITLMVHSFRLSLLDWLERTLSADLYIGQINRRAAQSGQALPSGLLQWLKEQPEVDQCVGLRMTPVFVALEGQQAFSTQLVAQQLPIRELKRFRLASSSSPPAAGEVWISEPFSRKHQLKEGQSLTLTTSQGPREYRVTGVFQDYASDSGYLMMELSNYQRDFADLSLSGIGVVLKDPAEDDHLRGRILQWPQAGALEVRSQRALRQISVEIFEQTFQVTQVLQVLAVLVAGAGILGAVAANQLERRREMAVWNCLGLSRQERRGLQWSEACLGALWAGLAAWPCGLLQAYAMVHFINRRAFGWSLDFHIDPLVLLSTPLLALTAATLAVALAGGSRRPPAEDLRQE